MNIYINAQNKKSLKAEENYSGLVNRLLKEYYSKPNCKCEAFPVVHSHLETDGESYAIRPEGFHKTGTDPAKVNGDISVEYRLGEEDEGVIPMAVEEIEGMRIPPMQQPKKSRLAAPAVRPLDTPTTTEDKMKEMHDRVEKVQKQGKKEFDFCKHGNVKNFCKKGCK